MDINIFAIVQSLWKDFTASAFFAFLKGFGIFAFAVLLIADVLLLSKRLRSDWKKAFYGENVPPLRKSRYLELWERIKRDAVSGDLSKAKIAVIEADKMLGETLEKIGYKGKDTGEKIAAVKPAQLTGLEEAKLAHEVFKKVVRNSEHKIDISEIEMALSGYEKVFRGLELLD